jgi:hypothetical protein
MLDDTTADLGSSLISKQPKENRFSNNLCKKHRKITMILYYSYLRFSIKKMLLLEISIIYYSIITTRHVIRAVNKQK